MSIESHTYAQPAWITALVEEVVVPAVTPLGFIGPLGFRFWEPDSPGNPGDAWQIVVFPTANLVCGSHKNDGGTFVAGFRLNIGLILNTIGHVNSVVWNSPASYNGTLDGPEIDIRGKFVGKVIWLRLFSLPPPDEPPAFRVNPQTAEVQELPA